MRTYTQNVQSITPGWHELDDMEVQFPVGYNFLSCIRVDSSQTGILLQPIRAIANGTTLKLGCNGYNLIGVNISNTILTYFVIYIKA